MFFERQGPAEWSFGLAFEVDGAVVQTYGPTTDEDGVFSAAYAVRRDNG